MTIQKPEQEICRVDGDTVTVLLSSTTLTLSMEEADSLNCILETDLIGDYCETVRGEEQDETIWIADVPIPRSEAWNLHRYLENIIDPDDVAVVDESGQIEADDLSPDRVNWLESGF